MDINSGIVQLITSLLRNLGVDGEQIKGAIYQFMDGQRRLLENIVANQERLDAADARIEAKLQFLLDQAERPYPSATTTELLTPNGRASGILVTDEKFPEQVLLEAGVSAEGRGK